MDAFEAYKQYCALKNHFTSKSYDYFKYNGRTRASYKAFEKRADKYFFHKLSRRKDVVDYLVANFVYAGDKWVGDLVNNEDADKKYRSLLKVRESLTYIFKEDINKLDDDLNSNFIVKDGQHPPLLKKYLRNEINIETLIILNDIVKFFGHWNRNLVDPVTWPSVYLKCKKYRPFFNYDKFKMRQIMLEKWAKIS
jgi:hypothetical protein